MKFSIGRKGRAAYAVTEIRFEASGFCLWNSAICLLAPAASFAGIQRSSAAPKSTKGDRKFLSHRESANGWRGEHTSNFIIGILAYPRECPEAEQRRIKSWHSKAVRYERIILIILNYVIASVRPDRPGLLKIRSPITEIWYQMGLQLIPFNPSWACPILRPTMLPAACKRVSSAYHFISVGCVQHRNSCHHGTWTAHASRHFGFRKVRICGTW